MNLAPVFEKAGGLVVARANDLVPVDTSFLQGSITKKGIDGDYNKGVIVFTPVEYAPYVEFGTRAPHFVPVEINGQETGIRGWAIRHGIKGADKPSFRGLLVRGKAQPFMRPAVDMEKGNIKTLLRNYVRQELLNISRAQ